MKTIYKYVGEVTDRDCYNGVLYTFDIPWEAQTLSVQFQEGTNQLCLWALVDKRSNFTKKVRALVWGTGMDITLVGLEWNQWVHAATQQQQDGFVWHIFMEREL